MKFLPIIYLVYMFISIYLLSFSLILYFNNRKHLFDYPPLKKKYSVSFVVPAYNEGKTIKDTINDKVIGNLITDSTGTYSFKLDDYLPLSAHASKEGFYNGNLQFTGPADIEELNFDNSSLCLTMIPTENPIVLNNVYFDFNSAKLKSESSADLDKIIEIMKKDTSVVFEISAHTDSKGSDSYNQKLSLARAKSVVDYLFKKGVPFFKLKVQGYGESHPIAPNENPDGSDNPEGRAKNRRVEAKLIK